MTEDLPKVAPGTLINRNVIVNGHRTSVRLESEMWTSLRDIAQREHKTIHELCSLVSQNKQRGRSLTSAVRVFLIAYYRSASTEDGHSRAGHGHGYRLLRANAISDRPEVKPAQAPLPSSNLDQANRKPVTPTAEVRRVNYDNFR